MNDHGVHDYDFHYVSDHDDRDYDVHVHVHDHGHGYVHDDDHVHVHDDDGVHGHYVNEKLFKNIYFIIRINNNYYFFIFNILHASSNRCGNMCNNTSPNKVPTEKLINLFKSELLNV